MKTSDSKSAISNRTIRMIHALLTFVLRAIANWIDRKKTVNENENNNENEN